MKKLRVRGWNLRNCGEKLKKFKEVLNSHGDWRGVKEPNALRGIETANVAAAMGSSQIAQPSVKEPNALRGIETHFLAQPAHLLYQRRVKEPNALRGMCCSMFQVSCSTLVQSLERGT
jgi:hypothetical protein